MTARASALASIAIASLVAGLSGGGGVAAASQGQSTTGEDHPLAHFAKTDQAHKLTMAGDPVSVSRDKAANYVFDVAKKAEKRKRGENVSQADEPVAPSFIPASYDLTKYGLPAGDQGRVGSCVTWATGYSAYGILLAEEEIKGAPMAPMYLYSQIVRKENGGQDSGTDPSNALDLLKEQGIDTQAHYSQGTSNYLAQPTKAQRANAAHYKLTGYADLTTDDVKQTLGSAENGVKNAISSGQPVVLAFEVRSSFENLDRQNFTYNPKASENTVGSHEVTIVGYDDKGVTVQNSWGSNWGDNGFFRIPWSYLEKSSDVDSLYAVGAVATDNLPA
jgi:C1A family cysteine protease